MSRVKPNHTRINSLESGSGNVQLHDDESNQYNNETDSESDEDLASDNFLRDP
jgi:hypothetical protein